MPFTNAFQGDSFNNGFQLLPAGTPGNAFQNNAFLNGGFQTLSTPITSTLFTFTTTQAGALTDYTPYLNSGVNKLDRDGDPDVLTFELVPWNPAFVKLKRGAYITLNSSIYPNWFTGYVTNDPELSYLGTNNNVPVWGYKYQATDDSYVLSLKPVGLMAPFVNTTVGSILKTIVSVVDTYSIFDLSNIDNGPLLARYVVDPNRKFADIVKELADLCSFRFRANNKKLYFKLKDATAATISINGATSNKNFTPSKLNIRPTTDPIVNDATVLGVPEPQNFITEYLLGDGFTAQWPLLSGMYGSNSATLLTDDMSGSQLNNQIWTVDDNGASHLQMENGYLNFLGGNANGTFDVHVDSALVMPLEAILRLTHGMWDFVSTGSQSVAGIIGGLWTQAPNSSMTGCVYGINVSKVSTNLVLSPIINGVVDGTQTLTIDLTKRYVIRTLCNFSRVIRQNTSYSYIDNTGVAGALGGDAVADTVTYSTWITPIDPVTGAPGTTTQFITNNATISSTTSFATYVLGADNDLHATVMGVTISVPMAASLYLKPSGGSAFIPKLVGVNEIDSLDGLAPVATVVSSGTSSQQATVGLGTPQFNPGADTLTFFKDTTKQVTYVPQVGDIVRFVYRRAGLSVGRVQDPSSVAVESVSWGDDGVRSLTKSDLSPLPRTSTECELAAAALIKDMGFQHYEGDYTQYSLYEFTGEPLAGTVLNFVNLPSSFPSALQAEVISEVATTLYLTSPQEYFEHKVTFGKPNNIQRVLGQLYRAQDQVDYGLNVDAVDVPSPTYLASIGAVNVTDVAAPTLVSLTSSNLNFNTNQAAPSGGGFEVRLTDESWGADDAKNLVLRTSSQTFSVPRNVRGKVFFIKGYDARNKLTYSEDFSNAAWTKTSAAVTNSLAVNPNDAKSQISSIAFTAGGTVVQDSGITLSGHSGVFSASVKGTVGQTVVLALVSTASGLDLATTTVTLNGQWQRASVTFTAGAVSGNFRCVIRPTSGSLTVSVTQASFEQATAETAYFKTNSTAYGAQSRFAAGIRVNYPFVPPAPTAAITVIDPSNPLVTVTLPALLQDVWGVEIRASDNTTVLYHADLTDSGLIITHILAGNTSLTPSVYVYTYNLLGEFSSSYNATTSFAILTSGVASPTATPGVPTSLDASFSGQGDFVFLWKPPSGATNTDLLSYQVQTATDSGFTTALTTYGPINATQFYLHAPSQTLYWRVAAKYPASSLGSYASTGAAVASGQPVLGTDVPNGLNAFAATGATLSYRPLGNYITAHDAGSNITINLSSGTMRIAGFGDVSLNSGSITALSYSTLYYIYYDDPNLTGGTVTYIATTTKEGALSNAGRFFLGSIITPPATGPDTAGNNDGGAGAQTGHTNLFLFGATTTATSGPSATLVNPMNAIDGDAATFSQLDITFSAGSSNATLDLKGSSPTSGSWTSLTLSVLSDVVMSGTGVSATLSYSLDGGASFTIVYSTTVTRAKTVDSVALPKQQNLALVIVRSVISRSGGVSTDTGTMKVYDSWVSGLI